MGRNGWTPEQWRTYRAANRERLNAAQRARRALGRVRGDRSREYSKRASRALPPLGPLFPELVRGQRLSFWEDELRMDLAQEAALARIEGRDEALAVRAYRAREIAWRSLTAPLIDAAVAA